LQDKALATVAIAFDQAGVQLGNAEREADGFASSTVRLTAEIRQLKEDIGTELVPAAQEVLPLFREFAFEVAPELIRGFGGFAKSTLVTVFSITSAFDFILALTLVTFPFVSLPSGCFSFLAFTLILPVSSFTIGFSFSAII